MSRNISLQIKQAGHEVSPMIYGQFIEHILNCITGGIYDPENPLSDVNGIRLDVFEKAKALNPPILRFPGGTVTCLYHWEDAIGPKENRIRRRNIIWGGEIDPSFGTAEFVEYCRKIGAEPMICVNMASGTPEEAGNWIEYCNGTGNSYYANLRRSHGYNEPFNVKYWCIGNESYAEPDIGIHNDVTLYIRDAREYIKYIKLNDKTAKTILVGCDDMSWNHAVLDALHPMCDYFSYHHYSSEGNHGLYGPFVGELNLIRSLDTLSSLLDEYPETVENFNPWYRFPPRSSKIKLALDEWNIWNANNSETYGLDMIYNWRDALWVASVLNDLLSRESVGIANMAQMVNVIAPILTDKTDSWYQTIAYPLLAYRHSMLGQHLALDYCSPKLTIDRTEIPALNLCALQQPDESIHIAAVNRDFEHEYSICLPYSGTAEITELSAPAESICTKDSCCVQTCKHTSPCSEIVLAPGSLSIIKIHA